MPDNVQQEHLMPILSLLFYTLIAYPVTYYRCMQYLLPIQNLIRKYPTWKHWKEPKESS
jgi:hypothetical protein